VTVKQERKDEKEKESKNCCGGQLGAATAWGEEKGKNESSPRRGAGNQVGESAQGFWEQGTQVVGRREKSADSIGPEGGERLEKLSIACIPKDQGRARGDERGKKGEVRLLLKFTTWRKVLVREKGVGWGVVGDVSLG